LRFFYNSIKDGNFYRFNFLDEILGIFLSETFYIFISGFLFFLFSLLLRDVLECIWLNLFRNKLINQYSRALIDSGLIDVISREMVGSWASMSPRDTNGDERLYTLFEIFNENKLDEKQSKALASFVKRFMNYQERILCFDIEWEIFQRAIGLARYGY